MNPTLLWLCLNLVACARDATATATIPATSGKFVHAAPVVKALGNARTGAELRSRRSGKPTTERASDEGSVSAKPNPALEPVQSQIVAKLRAIDTDDARFLDQLELSIATRAFAEAKLGAEQMLDGDGVPVQNAVDGFHNYLDEFVRAMSQFETGPLPASNDYGIPAKENAKHLSKPVPLADLKQTARRIKKDMVALKSLANRTSGLEDVASFDASKLDATALAAYTARVVANVELVTGKVGLGPVFAPAVAEADPLRAAMVKLVQAANGLVDDDDQNGSDDAEKREDATRRWNEFESWLAECVASAKRLGRNAPAWKDPGLGSRGALATASLERLAKAARAAKSRRSKA